MSYVADIGAAIVAAMQADTTRFGAAVAATRIEYQPEANAHIPAGNHGRCLVFPEDVEAIGGEEYAESTGVVIGYSLIFELAATNRITEYRQLVHEGVIKTFSDGGDQVFANYSGSDRLGQSGRLVLASVSDDVSEDKQRPIINVGLGVTLWVGI